MTQWIDKIKCPDDLKKVPLEKLPEVAEEYRQFLIESVAKTGGHLGANLGVLELSIALHYVLSSPEDFAKFMTAERVKWRTVIEASGARESM